MHLRTRIAITALAAPVFMAACSLEAYAQDSHSAASPETEAIAAPDCPEHDPAAAALPPQEELARDIRTIVTGEKSPIQQEALAQAARIAPEQMSDALREVLIDAAAFVAYVPGQDSTANARPDSLSRLLGCALQPHFSQEELAADVLSIISFDEQGHYLPGDRGRQTTAAWLTMHIPPGEMGEALQRAVVRGMLGIGSGNYPMHTVWYLLSEALSKQYAGYSDADLAAKIRAVQEGGKDIYAPLAVIHGTGRWVHPGFGGIGDPENIGPEARAAMIETLAWLNEKINERAWLLERFEAVGDKEGKKALETSDRDQWRSRRIFHSMLADAVQSLETPEAIEALANAGEFHFSFIRSGNRSVAPIVDVLSGERLYTRQAQARLSSLTDIVRYTPLMEETEPLSSENRDLIVRTAHRFLDREGLKDFEGLNMRGVLSSAVDLALALDEPDLIQIVETLASNREEAIARGVTPGGVEYFQESIEYRLQARQRSQEITDPFSEPELPQDELVAAIRAIMEGEEGDPQFKAVWQVIDIARTDPEQIEDTLRITLIEAFRYMLEKDEQMASDEFGYREYSGLTRRLGDALEGFGGIDMIKMFVEMDYYGLCGSGAWDIFSQFPEESILLLTEKIFRPTTRPDKISDGLYLLGDMVGRYKRGLISISRERRALLVTTARHFLEGNSVTLHGDSYVSEAAIRFSVMLEDPDLIKIVEELASDPQKVTALGVPQDDVKNIQQSARMYLGWRPMTYMISDC